VTKIKKRKKRDQNKKRKKSFFYIYGISGVSQSYSVGGSSDAAFRCQCCSQLFYERKNITSVQDRRQTDRARLSWSRRMIRRA